MTAHGPQPAWLARAVFYQIYPQSYYDANGDGIGDLAGIAAKLDYLADLGVNALWLNPCFVSPFKDAGYDVADHCCIAPRYGTNEQFKALLDAAHERGIRVCLDLVAGHTSDQHPWFVQSQRAEPNEFTDRYVWTNNPWVKRDGELDFISGNSDRAGAYAVNFFAHQPALNYGFANPERGYQQDVDAPGPRATRTALKEIMKFWLDLGVDGFRVDLAASLVKGDPERIGIRRLWREIRAWLDDHYRDRVLICEWGNPELAIDAGFHADFMQHVGVRRLRRAVARTRVVSEASCRAVFRQRRPRRLSAFLDGVRLPAEPDRRARSDQFAVVESRLRTAAARPRARRPEGAVHLPADVAAVAVHLLWRRDRHAVRRGTDEQRRGLRAHRVAHADAMGRLTAVRILDESERHARICRSIRWPIGPRLPRSAPIATRCGTSSSG